MTAVAFSPNGMALNNVPMFNQEGIDQLLGRVMPFKPITPQIKQLPTMEGLQKALSLFTMAMDTLQVTKGVAKADMGEFLGGALSLSEEVLEKFQELRRAQDLDMSVDLDMDSDQGQDLGPNPSMVLNRRR